jgi:serine kinase of HPr protein (carbohydrate metabolism regulator)
MLRLHATCVAIGSQGVLLIGESGAGKSDLALRLMDRGAKLVADDQVELTINKKSVIARAPASIQGLIEIRGVGIFEIEAKKEAKVLMVVQLAKQEWIERLPYPEPYDCEGVHIPQIRLYAFEPSSVIKIEMAVAALQDGSMKVGALKE